MLRFSCHAIAPIYLKGELAPGVFLAAIKHLSQTKKCTGDVARAKERL